MDGGEASKSSMSLEHGTVRELGSCDGKTGTIHLDSKPPKQRKERFVRSVAIALALIMVLGAGLGVLSLVKTSPDNEKVIPAVPMFMTHSPILIEGEVALTTANGVTGGDGTAGNPFIIQGWDIDASGATEAGIAVSNITSHLVIRNVNVHSGLSINLGIALMNLTHCTVEYSRSTDNVAGIGALMCDHIVIQNNILENNDQEGILVFNSNYSWVSHNIAVGGAGIGVALFNSHGSSVVNNTMSYNAVAGLALEFCNLTTVLNNIMENNMAGLMLVMSNWSAILYNNITQSSTYGVFLMGSQNNTLAWNMIADTSVGYGAYLMFSTYNTLHHNNFVDNSMSPQASDDSDTNKWNLSYPTGGNYWSDYTGSDTFRGANQNLAGPDGLGDTPYDIDSTLTVQDDYPLMMKVRYDNSPTAFFTVTPASGTVSTTFTFNASLTWDPDNLTSDLKVRWDFNGDGTWDTGWSTDKIVQHTYTQAGEYNVTMEVISTQNRTGNTTWHVEVDPLVIPEFTTLLVPICSMIAIFLVVGALVKRR
jgi:parallel beta-helix repeat protein